MTGGIGPWGPARADDLAALCDAAAPAERLTGDELLACCWEDPGVVLGTADGRAAVSACVQTHGDRVVGFVKLIAVEPAAQGLGVGRALLDAAHGWAFDGQGAAEVRVAGPGPFYIWPGVDFRATRALCLFESFGYWPVGAEFNMACPTTYRADPPAGVTIDRALDDDHAAAVLALVAAHWPGWVPETSRALDHGACFAARDAGGSVLGFGCHSVNRAGWIGPMGTDPERHHGGVGGAVLGALCRDLMAAGFADAEIAWVGPAGFYARTAGAAVSRVFRTLTRRR